MLSAQVEYWKLVENKRHNIANEQWQNDSLLETERHNTVTEKYNYDVLGETKRHNDVSEALGFAELNERIRSNKAQENIGWSNAANQGKQAAAALQNAATNRINSEINQQNADTSQYGTYQKAYNDAQNTTTNRMKVVDEMLLNETKRRGEVVDTAKTILSPVTDLLSVFSKASGKTGKHAK